MMRGKPYISVYNAMMKASKRPRERHSLFLPGTKERHHKNGDQENAENGDGPHTILVPRTFHLLLLVTLTP